MKQRSFDSKGNSLTVTEIYTVDRSNAVRLPLFLESVSAGFPSPADDYMEGQLNLNDLLIRNPSATFFVRVTGDSMIEASINSGDLLIVDRSLEPKSGSIVIAIVNGELTVKRLSKKGTSVYLLPENKNYEPLEITKHMYFEVWGVVTNVVHSVL